MMNTRELHRGYSPMQHIMGKAPDETGRFFSDVQPGSPDIVSGEPHHELQKTLELQATAEKALIKSCTELRTFSSACFPLSATASLDISCVCSGFSSLTAAKVTASCCFWLKVACLVFTTSSVDLSSTVVVLKPLSPCTWKRFRPGRIFLNRDCAAQKRDTAQL